MVTARVLLIEACIECPFSEGSSVCWHVATPGKVASYRGERECRPLPSVSGYAHPEHAPPPGWCPLPKAPPDFDAALRLGAKELA